MGRKDELLSIGEMAKLSGAGIRALHYYERKNILKPAYVDPITGYRYYSLSQLNFIFLIMNCVEFNIPLKNITSVIDTDDVSVLKKFLENSNDVLEKKANLLKMASRAIKKALSKMELGNQYETGKIYAREFEEKNYYAKSYGQTLKGKNLITVLYEITDELYGRKIRKTSEITNMDDLIPLPDVGFLSEHQFNEKPCYYGFVEMPKHFARKNIITIPAGTYYFRQSERSEIENSSEIFKKQLKGKNTFMIVETEESFLSKTKVSQTLYELRLIVL